MTVWTLLARSLVYHLRTHAAVALGVVAGTAVIGGALVVGDSVRDSLRQMTLVRLGRIDHVLAGHRFFREDLAAELAGLDEFRAQFEAAAPALALRGAFVHADEEGATDSRAGNVPVWGVDERFWELLDAGDVPVPTGEQVVLNERVAEQLGVREGDAVRLSVELPLSIPRESLFGKRDETSREIGLTVAAVLPETVGAARLAFDPSQQVPPNAFVPLSLLQKELGLSEVRPTRRSPDGRPARVNALVAAARDERDRSGGEAPRAAEALDALLARVWKLDDFGLRVRASTAAPAISVESERMILDDALADAALQAAERSGLRAVPVLVHLGNELSNAKDPQALARYATIAGTDVLGGAPVGPFEWVGEAPAEPLRDRAEKGRPNTEAVIIDWLAEDLKVGVGDEIRVTYHLVGSHGDLPEEEVRFVVRGIVKLAGTRADDRTFVPEVKGVTDVDSFDEWDKPFPMKEVTRRDDEYWKLHRAVPKVFVTPRVARELWTSRYGEQTSVRIALPEGQESATGRDRFVPVLLSAIDPGKAGMTFAAAKRLGLQAAAGTTDFGGLFVGFSFFLILSATILIALLFGLGIERRASSLGLLSAVGWSAAQVRRQCLLEGLVVVTIGGLVGIGAAVGYAAAMVHGLKTWWIGAIGTRFLFVSVHPTSLVLGWGIATAVGMAAVWWSVRRLRNVSPRALLAGSTADEGDESTKQARVGRRRRTTGILFAGCGVLAAAAAFGLVPASEAFFGLSWQVLAFFATGLGLLSASLTLLADRLESDRAAAVKGAGAAGVARLGARNAARHRSRSTFTVGLIASAAFVIVAVAAGRRNPAVEQPQRDSGNGGYVLVARSSVPIVRDFGTPEGRRAMNLAFGGNAADETLFESTEVMPFRVQPGEDASCLNLYRTRLPTVLGVPQRLIDRGGFRFAGTPGAEPWKLLEGTGQDGAIPVLGDMNTLLYGLHKQPGDTIDVPDSDSPTYRLRVAGMLDGSVFQGVLLMSEENFLKLYPDRDGYQYFLLANDALPDDASRRAAETEVATKQSEFDALRRERETLAARAERDESALVELDRRIADVRHDLSAARRRTLPPVEQLAVLFESKLADFGFDAEPVARRLADFLAVQNTYLSTFEALGGLGLLLGSLGLATVMLRNVLERRRELGLLRAVGFRSSSLAVLVLAENALLLTWGLSAGTIAALLAMVPHLRGTGADVPWSHLAIVLGAVFATGMAAALLAVRDAVRTPLLAALRNE